LFANLRSLAARDRVNSVGQGAYGHGKPYRSQHELLPLFKKGDSPHVNNVALGRKGRWRSNVWTYLGASSFSSDARRGLANIRPSSQLLWSPTRFVTAGTSRSTFLGSGSTLMAAERTGRFCRGVELDPLYIDIILRRYEAETGQSVVLEETGETFDELREKRPCGNAGGLRTRISHETGSENRRTLVMPKAHALAAEAS
jgi:hypothetical protein